MKRAFFGHLFGLAALAAAFTAFAAGSAVGDTVDDVNAGVSAIADGDFDRAISIFTGVIEAGSAELTDAETAVVFFNRGTAYQLKRESPNAIVDYSRAIAINPGDYLAYYNRAIAYENTGAYVKALADYGSAAFLNSDDARIFFNRGNLRSYLGDFAGALVDYRWALRLEPGDDVFAAGLATAETGHGAFLLAGLGTLGHDAMSEARAFEEFEWRDPGHPPYRSAASRPADLTELEWGLAPYRATGALLLQAVASSLIADWSIAGSLCLRPVYGCH